MPTLAVTATAALLAGGVTLRDTEAALVQRFCRQHGLTPAPGGVVHELTSDASPGAATAFAALEGVGNLSLDELVMAFETLVPAPEAKAFGAVFTPEAITSFMAREALARLVALGVPLASATVVDPAVGCAALLVAALRAITTATGQRPGAVASRLYGTDISPESVHRARILLALTALYLGDPDEPDLTATIVVADALSANWAALFGRAVFSLVLGNPPYVRYQQLAPEQRAALAARWQSCGRGNFNLYFPFFEVAASLADPAGSVVAYITPNNFATSLSGGRLRAWLSRTAFLDDVLDFGHHRVFEAMTYTAISFGSRFTGRAPVSFGYTTVAGLAALGALPGAWAAGAVAEAYAALGGAPWRLVGRDDAVAVEALAGAGTPLSSLADVRYGIATCRDKLYLLTGKMDSDGNYVKAHGQVVYAIEPGITRRCTKVSGLTNQVALAADTTRVLYPYLLADGKATVLAEDALAAQFPGAYAYLLAIRGQLAARDLGRKVYPAWYAYARTQSLAPSGAKLLTPLYAASPRFLRDADPQALFMNGCAVTVRPGAPAWVSLDLLSLILNSGLCRYFIESTSTSITGGFFAYQKSHLGALGIVRIDADALAGLVLLSPGAQDDALAAAYHVQLPGRYRRTR